MLELAERIARDTLERLTRLTTSHLPELLAALFILLVTWCLAAGVGWLLMRLFRGARIDQFLRRSGLASLLPGESPVRARQMAARGSYWAILTGGFLLALSAFDTQLTSRMIEWVLFMVPKLLAGAVILVAGLWVSRYLGRSALVWAFNENIPHSRQISQAVRIVVIFVAVVVAADYLNFARNVFLASFILIIGGAILASSLALGLGGRKIVERYLESKDPGKTEKAEPVVWKHL
jgi:hypothetical protein